MNESNGKCQYDDPDGFTCPNDAGESGFCYWHDANRVKSCPDIKDKLIKYARSGGFTRGISLKRAELEDVDLVSHGSKTGYDFSHADFYRAKLRGAHLFNINLQNASLMKADLREANVNCANMQCCNLLGVRWQDSKIENINIGKRLKQQVLARKAEKNRNQLEANDYWEQAEEIYRDLRKHAEHEGIFTLAGKFIQKELYMRRMQHPKFSFKRISSKVVDLFCGYGEAPLRIVGISILIILCCACLYCFTGLNYNGELQRYDSSAPLFKNGKLFLSCLYYSVVTFTTLGYGDFTPIGISRAIAAMEAFTGSFTIALFVVVFVKKMTR